MTAAENALDTAQLAVEDAADRMDQASSTLRIWGTEDAADALAYAARLFAAACASLKQAEERVRTEKAENAVNDLLCDSLSTYRRAA